MSDKKTKLGHPGNKALGRPERMKTSIFVSKASMGELIRWCERTGTLKCEALERAIDLLIESE